MLNIGFEMGENDKTNGERYVLVTIRVVACDDSTNIQMEITPKQYAFLADVANRITSASSSDCMPKMYVSDITPAPVAVA